MSSWRVVGVRNDKDGAGDSRISGMCQSQSGVCGEASFELVVCTGSYIVKHLSNLGWWKIHARRSTRSRVLAARWQHDIRSPNATCVAESLVPGLVLGQYFIGSLPQHAAHPGVHFLLQVFLVRASQLAPQASYKEHEMRTMVSFVS